MKKSLLLTSAAVCLVSMSMTCEVPPEEPPTPVFSPVFSSTAQDVNDFISEGGGGDAAKLVFIDMTTEEEKLCYIDFSEGVEIHEIDAAKGAKVPVISPDGEWVVYASGEGAETGSTLKQRSSVYISRLEEGAQPVLVAKDSACEPRFEQNPPDGKQVVIYTTLAPNSGWEGFGKTIKAEVDVSGAAPVIGTREVLVATGSYAGGLSFDEKFLCGGGEDVAMLDLESGGGVPETLSYNGIQSCNASISSSRIFTNTMMYLDLQTSHPDINGGTQWLTWQVILISNIEKEVVKGFMVPQTYEFPLETEDSSLTGVKWHHPEWSNHPYFAAATINAERYFRDGSDIVNTAYQERIYLVNLKDSVYLEVLRPDTLKYLNPDAYQFGFHWPWLWVEVPNGFSEEPGWLEAD
jgi:hypothetical protein